MKRKLTAGAVCTAVMMMTGCGEGRSAVRPAELPKEYSGTAVMTIEGQEYTADLRRSVTGDWELSFTAPETVEGLKMTSDGADLVLSLGDMSFTADRSKVPRYGAFLLLTESIDLLIAGDVSSLSKGGDTEETGIVEGMDMRAVIHDGELLTLEVEGCLKAEFC